MKIAQTFCKSKRYHWVSCWFVWVFWQIYFLMFNKHTTKQPVLAVPLSSRLSMSRFLLSISLAAVSDVTLLSWRCWFSADKWTQSKCRAQVPHQGDQTGSPEQMYMNLTLSAFESPVFPLDNETVFYTWPLSVWQTDIYYLVKGQTQWKWEGVTLCRIIDFYILSTESV